MAGGGGGAPDQGGDKNTYYILWVLALIGFVGGIVWYFFADELKSFFIFIKTYEILGVYLALAPLKYLDIPLLNDMVGNLAFYLDVVRGQTNHTITLDIAEAISTGIGEYLRYPFALIIILLCTYSYKTHILMRCTQKHNMKSLLKQEMVRWPQIKIADKVDIHGQDLDIGPWAMTTTPMQFAKKYKLISVEVAPQIGSPYGKSIGPEFKMTLDRARAERAFAAQLGRPWQRFEVLPPHRRAILSVLAGKGSRDSKKALDMVYQFARSAADGKLDLTDVDATWSKHSKLRAVEKICQSHAYEFTVIASMLLYAREDGVMASADFLWVKPLDRRLWYLLNNVGRQTPAVEVGGIFAHWYTELALKRALSVPDVGGAVTALDVSLSDIIYVPENEKEREEIYQRSQAKAPAPAPETETPNETGLS